MKIGTRVRLADATTYPYADQDETGTILGTGEQLPDVLFIAWDAHPEYRAAPCHPSRLQPL